MNNRLRKFDPAVDKKFLIALSGIIWSVVGIILCSLAVQWLSHTTLQKGVLLAITGIALAFMIYRFGFMKLVDKNIERIRTKQGKVCIFGFQPWKSYIIIVIMIELGRTLRLSPLPKPYLAIIYIGFGGAMLLSSLIYYRFFLRLISNS